jgi:hypothetical protein
VDHRGARAAIARGFAAPTGVGEVVGDASGQGQPGDPVPRGDAVQRLTVVAVELPGGDQPGPGAVVVHRQRVDRRIVQPFVESRPGHVVPAGDPLGVDDVPGAREIAGRIEGKAGAVVVNGQRIDDVADAYAQPAPGAAVPAGDVAGRGRKVPRRVEGGAGWPRIDRQGADHVLRHGAELRAASQGRPRSPIPAGDLAGRQAAGQIKLPSGVKSLSGAVVVGAQGKDALVRAAAQAGPRDAVPAGNVGGGCTPK